MKEYKVKMLDKFPECFDDIEKAEINECVWLFDYKPYSFAQVVFVKNEGFLIKLTSFESNPKAVHQGFYSNVYKDSCLEMFAKFDNSCEKYVNIETNSIGASLIAIGKDRHERVRIDEIIEKPFPVKAFKDKDKWSTEIFVSLKDLEKLYGLDRSIFKEGYEFYGNFYKCGDETETEHYVMWNRVETEKPDYHRPEYFGKFILI